MILIIRMIRFLFFCSGCIGLILNQNNFLLTILYLELIFRASFRVIFLAVLLTGNMEYIVYIFIIFAFSAVDMVIGLSIFLQLYKKKNTLQGFVKYKY